ncbi:MAG: hypothetical protein OHK0053_29000 [Microscillaceae bacterium]
MLSNDMKSFAWFYLLMAGTLLFLSACEDVINIDLDETPPQLVVDAWITDQPGPQTIKLRLSQPYFENEPAPAVTGATVEIEDDLGNVYDFTDPDQNGDYVWTPPTPGEALGVLNRSYTLRVSYQGETFQATSQINRVPVIDSLVYEFREEELGNPAAYYAQVYARDFVGSGDTYWIRTFKNGEFLSRGGDINIAYDAGFSAGGNVDGLYFITPIREGINPFRLDENDEVLPPYELNDTIYVEIYSITNEAFFFLQQVQTQLTNGGLFAVPTTNVPTNLVNLNPNSPIKALGYFGASAVSAAGVRIEEE